MYVVYKNILKHHKFKLFSSINLNAYFLDLRLEQKQYCLQIFSDNKSWYHANLLLKYTFFYKSLHFTGKRWTNQENAFLRSISRVKSPLMCKTQTSARVMSRHCVTAHGRFPDVQSCKDPPAPLAQRYPPTLPPWFSVAWEAERSSSSESGDGCCNTANGCKHIQKHPFYTLVSVSLLAGMCS